MLIQLGLSTTLDDGLGQLFDQSSLCEDLTRICACFEPFVSQFGSYGHLFLLPSSSSSVFQVDHFHKIVYTLVAGNQHQVVRNGSSSNEEIRLVNELAFASQIATKGGIAFGNGAISANHRCRLQKQSQALLRDNTLLPIVDTLIHLSIRHNT